jgi:hypothetical protein
MGTNFGSLGRSSDISRNNANKRRFGRLRCSMAHSMMGEIVDLSAGGMRVRGKTRPKHGEIVETTILTAQGPLVVKAMVKWTKRVRLFWFEIGLEFVELAPESRKTICEFARIACEQEYVRPSVKEDIDEHRKAS